MTLGQAPAASPIYNASPGSGSYHASPVVPGGMVAPSPVGIASSPSQNAYSANSPFSAYSPHSSHGNTSASYNSPGSLQPGSAGSNAYTMPADMADWYTPDILVVINKLHDEKELVGEQGVIRSVVGTNLCNVWIQKLEKVCSVAGNALQPVAPEKDDKVKVIQGEDRDNIGTLISIDGYDGIVRMEQDKQLKILHLRYLGKLAKESWFSLNSNWVSLGVNFSFSEQ